MVKLGVKTGDGLERETPDIFRAAAEDDAAELERALKAGQSLDEFGPGYHSTPLHVACMNRSEKFLRAAMGYDFNPWVRDENLRLAIDHAWANSLTETHEALAEKMYPGGRVSSNAIAFQEPDPQA